FPSAHLWGVTKRPCSRREKAKRNNQSSRFCFHTAHSRPNLHLRSIIFFQIDWLQNLHCVLIGVLRYDWQCDRNTRAPEPGQRLINLLTLAGGLSLWLVV